MDVSLWGAVHHASLIRDPMVVTPGHTEMTKPIVEMRGISKRYGGVQALQSVDLDIYLGEVHALVGDNAAGKSTLIKTLAGAVLKDEGTITFEGRAIEINAPRDAKALGIETVYQDLALADNLNVSANVFLGRELTRNRPLSWFLDNRRMEKESRTLLGKLKINIPNIRQQVRSMSGGQRQSIAIARCVCFNARVVILDEPTAALGVEETRKVYGLIRDMREHGLGVLLISHNLNHVFENCDRITVLKTGRLVGSRRVEDTTQDEILRMIVSGVTDNGGPPARAPARIAVV
jgi:D-xylose transport system ATP-binding protein